MYTSTYDLYYTLYYRDRKMAPDKVVDLYKSHKQTFTGYAMAKPPLKRATSEEATGFESLARSLNNSFYVTSYQSDIARHALTTGKLIAQGVN